MVSRGMSRSKITFYVSSRTIYHQTRYEIKCWFKIGLGLSKLQSGRHCRKSVEDIVQKRKYMKQIC